MPLPSRTCLHHPVYTTAEYDGCYPATLRPAGVLLDAVIEGPPPDPHMERLIHGLQERPGPIPLYRKL